MLKENVLKELQAYALNVISSAKANIGKNNNSGQLANSLDFQLDDTSDWGGTLYFYALAYGKFLDQGVQGANPNELPAPGTNKKGETLKGAKWYGIQKAPLSPYKFGSGTGGPGLKAAIDRWSVQKGIPGIRDEKGRFIPRKSLVRLMARSIYLSGLSPTYFFTDAQKKYDSHILDKLGDAFIVDVQDKMNETLKPLRNNQSVIR